MPKIAGIPIREGASLTQCSVDGCDGEPRSRFRVAGAFAVYLNLCSDHAGLLHWIPVTLSVDRVTEEEWIVWQVMES